MSWFAWSHKTGKLPVPNFSAGGIATPADAALMMQLGAEAIFVGSGIFMKERATPLDVEKRAPNEEREEAVSRAKAIVIATTHYNDPKILAEASEQVTGTMKGLAVAALEENRCFCKPAAGRLGAHSDELQCRAPERQTSRSIGVLAIQGDYDAHAQALAKPAPSPSDPQTRRTRRHRRPHHPRRRIHHLPQISRARRLPRLPPGLRRTKPTFGTCAGCILLATEVTHPPQQSLGVLDATVERNAYGRQIDSAIHTSETSLPGGPLEMVYIRAPAHQVKTSVEVLAERDGFPVLVEQGHIMAATFHPELSDDRRVHQLLVDLVRDVKAAERNRGSSSRRETLSA